MMTLMTTLMTTLAILGQGAATWSLMLVTKATLILLVAAVGHWGLRRAAAATRHLWWMLALLAVLALPLLSTALPSWQWQLPAMLAQAAQPPVLPFAGPISASALDGLATDAALATQPSASGLETVPAVSVWTWQRFIAFVWLCGFWFVLGRVALGWLGAWSLRQTAAFVTEYGWSISLRHMSERLQLRAHVQLLLSSAVNTPLTCGILHPAVLLPLEALTWPESWRHVVLLHELAHIKRRDCLTQLMAQFACAIFWFHPLVWRAARQLRVERELACDDAVLATGTRATDYASYLLELARPLTQGYDVLAPVTVGIGGSQLESRVRALLDPAAPRAAVTRQRLALAICVGAAMLLPFAALRVAVAQAAPALLTATSEAEFSATANLLTAPEMSAVAHPPAPEINKPETLSREAVTQVSISESPASENPGSAVATADEVIEQQEPNQNPGSGKSLTVDELVEMKLFNVTPEFTEMLRRNGYDNVARKDLKQLRVHDIDESFIKEMRALSSEQLSLPEIVRLRISGVTTGYAQQMKQAGLGAVSLRQLGQMRLHGVTPDYIASLRQLGYDKLTAEQLTQLRIHGVTAAYINDLRKSGFENLNLEDIKRMRIHGLTPEYGAAIKAAGVANASLDDLLNMRIHGITTEFVQRMRAALNKEVSAKDLLRLKISGIDEMLQKK